MNETIKQLISKAEIDKRVSEIASKIENDYLGEEVVMICVLTGSAVFTADLSRKISKIPVIIEFFSVSSYGLNTESNGIKKTYFETKVPLDNKNIIVIEDIVDTGSTLDCIMNHLKTLNPKSIKICSLLEKTNRRAVKGLDIDYLGFNIGDYFVVGYGIDYANKYRNLSYIGSLEFVE